MVILPDTQYYIDLRHELWRLYWPDQRSLTAAFFNQTRWVALTQSVLRTKLAVFVGDLTQADASEEWDAFAHGLRALTEARVPFVLAQGDHDLGYERTGVPPFAFRKAAHRRSRLSRLHAAAVHQPHFRGTFDGSIANGQRTC